MNLEIKDTELKMYSALQNDGEFIYQIYNPDLSIWQEIVKRVNLHEELIERLKQAYDMLMTQSEGVKYPTILAIEDTIQKATNKTQG